MAEYARISDRAKPCLMPGVLVLRVRKIMECHIPMVGKIGPGASVGSKLEWDHYRPGDCVFCKSPVFPMVWRGYRKNRIKVESVKMTSIHGIELAGPAKLTVCRGCWQDNYLLWKVMRADDHQEPCVCQTTALGMNCCGNDARELTPMGLLAYRSGEKWSDARKQGDIAHQWPVEVKMRKKGFGKPLKTLKEWMVDTLSKSKCTKSMEINEETFPPLITEDSRWDWVTVGTKQRLRGKLSTRKLTRTGILHTGQRVLVVARIIYRIDTQDTIGYSVQPFILDSPTQVVEGLEKPPKGKAPWSRFRKPEASKGKQA